MISIVFRYYRETPGKRMLSGGLILPGPANKPSPALPIGKAGDALFGLFADGIVVGVVVDRRAAVGRQRGDEGAVQPPEEHQGHQQGGDLRQGIAPPDQIIVADRIAVAGQDIGNGHQKHQLPDDGGGHGVHRFAQGLEGAAQGDAGSGHAEAQGDDPQGRDAHLEHGVRGVEDLQQRPGNGPEDDHAQHHDAGGVDGAALDGLHHPQPVLGPVVIGHDGHHAVVQAEHRHEDEAVELEVNAEGRGRRLLGGVVRDEDLVHAEGHHRADGHHDDAGQADGVDVAHQPPIGPEAPELQVNFLVLLQVEDQGQDTAAELADDRGHRRAGNAHVQHEDKDGVQHDVHNGAQTLGIHGQDGPAGALQQPLEHDLAEQAQGAAAADQQIVRAVFHNVVDLGLGPEEGPGKQQRQHGADGKAHHRQEHAVDGHSVGPLLVLGSQGPAHQGVDAHGGAGGQTDHQVLGRKRQGHGGQRLLTHPGHEHAVHDVVQGLHQHGDDNGQGHVDNQLGNGHGAQLVFFFHGTVSPP